MDTGDETHESQHKEGVTITQESGQVEKEDCNDDELPTHPQSEEVHESCPDMETNTYSQEGNNGMESTTDKTLSPQTEEVLQGNLVVDNGDTTTITTREDTVANEREEMAEHGSTNDVVVNETTEEVPKDTSIHLEDENYSPEEESSDDNTDTVALEEAIFLGNMKNRVRFDDDAFSVQSEMEFVDSLHEIILNFEEEGNSNKESSPPLKKRSILTEQQYLEAMERTGKTLQHTTTLAGLHPTESDSAVFKMLITKGKFISDEIKDTLASWNPSKESQAFLVKYSKWPKMSVFEQSLDYFYCICKENNCSISEILQMKGFTLHFQNTKKTRKRRIKVKFHRLWNAALFPRPTLHHYIVNALDETTKRLQTFMKVACNLNSTHTPLLPSVKDISEQSKDFVLYSRHLVKVMFVSLVVFEHFFKLEAKSSHKPQGFQLLLNFVVEVTKKGKDFTKHWRILENFLRVFPHAKPTEKEQLALDELLQNPSNIAQFVRTRARDPAVSPEKYRDKLVADVHESFQIKTHMYFGGGPSSAEKLLLMVRWYVFSWIYAQPDLHGLVLLKNKTMEQDKAQRERHLSLKNIYPDEVEKFYGRSKRRKKNSNSTTKKKKTKTLTSQSSAQPSRRRMTIVEHDEDDVNPKDSMKKRLIIADDDIDEDEKSEEEEDYDTLSEEESSTTTPQSHETRTKRKQKDDAKAISATTTVQRQMEDVVCEENELDGEENKAAGKNSEVSPKKRNPSEKLLVVVDTDQNLYREDRRLGLCIENASCIKIFEMSIAGDVVYHVDFHLYNHRVGGFQSTVKEIFTMKPFKRSFMMFRHESTDIYTEFGIIRSTHNLYHPLKAVEETIEWEYILTTIIQNGVPSRKRDSEKREAYRFSLGTSNHNYEFNSEFFRPIPRWNCGLDKLENRFKKNIGILLDGVQLTVDRALESCGTECCMDDFFLKTFSLKLRKELYANTIRFPCVDLTVTFMDEDGCNTSTINEHTDDKNGRKKGNNYTVTNSRFFTIMKNGKKYNLRFTCILYTRVKIENFAVAEEKTQELRTKLDDFKSRYQCSYQGKGFQGYTPMDIKISDSTIFEKSEDFKGKEEVSILTFPASAFIEIWAAPGLDILYRYLLLTKYDTDLGAELMTLILYQTAFVEFYLQGVALLEECKEMPTLIKSFTITLAERLTSVVGHSKGGHGSRHRTSKLNWVEHYSNSDHLVKARNSLKEMITSIENTDDEKMDAKSFQELVGKHKKDFLHAGNLALQRIPIFSALVGFIIKLRPQNAMYAFPPADDCGSMLALQKAGFDQQTYEKGMKFSCHYFGIEPRLYWGENLLCEGGHRDDSKMSDILIKGQRLFFLFKEGSEYIVRTLIILPNTKWENLPMD